MEGGPNHAGNFCDSPILADTKTGTLHYQSSYYYIGHFSRFIRPGAKRLTTKINSWMTPATVDGRIGNTMETCAFLNTDNTIALIVTNRTEADMIYSLNLSQDEHSDPQTNSQNTFVCPPRAIQTIIIE